MLTRASSAGAPPEWSPSFQARKSICRNGAWLRLTRTARRPGLDATSSVINGWPVRGTTLYTSGQIVREYLSVATRPAAQNGLGLTVSDALDNARYMTRMWSPQCSYMESRR